MASTSKERPSVTHFATATARQDFHTSHQHLLIPKLLSKHTHPRKKERRQRQNCLRNKYRRQNCFQNCCLVRDQRTTVKKNTTCTTAATTSLPKATPRHSSGSTTNTAVPVPRTIDPSYHEYSSSVARGPDLSKLLPGKGYRDLRTNHCTNSPRKTIWSVIAPKYFRENLPPVDARERERETVARSGMPTAPAHGHQPVYVTPRKTQSEFRYH